MTPLPEAPGHYLWHVLDMGYLNIGYVNVAKISPGHADWLRKREAEQRARGETPAFFLYESAFGHTMAMHHGARDHLPPASDDGRPLVDGYTSFDINRLWQK